MGHASTSGSDTGRLATQRVPPKVRSDGEVELTASLLAQRLLLLAVLVALLPALPHVLRVPFLDRDLAFLDVTEAAAVGFGRRRCSL